MDRRAWQATVHGDEKVRHNLATKEREIISILVFCLFGAFFFFFLLFDTSY